MARKWIRNENDVALNLDRNESEAMLAAYTLVRDDVPETTGWLLGFEAHFIARGMAVTSQAIERFNSLLAKAGLDELRFRDEGEGRPYEPSDLQAILRKEFLDALDEIDDDELEARYKLLVERNLSEFGGAQAFDPNAPAPAPAKALRPDGSEVVVERPFVRLGAPVSTAQRLKLASAPDEIRRPRLDPDTLRSLIGMAPDDATAAWLTAYLRAASK